MRTDDVARIHTQQPGSASRRFARRGLVPAAVLAGSLGASTLAGASSAQQPVVSTAKVAGLGTILVASHRPLYEMVNDPRGHSSCNGACAKIWKPLIVTRKEAHHLGHVSGLGTIHRSKGQLQAAIHGHALYFFSGDHSESHASGQGIASDWFTVNANGTLDRTMTSGTVVTAPPASPPTSSSGSSPASPTTTQPTSAPSTPMTPAPNNSAPSSPAPTSPPPTSPPPTTPPTSPPTPTTVPPTTTTTTSGGGGGVGF